MHRALLRLLELSPSPTILALESDPVVLRAKRVASTALVIRVKPQPHLPDTLDACLEANCDLEMLFVKRSVYPGDPWSGQVAFPGGKAEPDETFTETAIRETQEEIGIDLNECAECLCCLKPIEIFRAGRHMVVLPFGRYPKSTSV